MLVVHDCPHLQPVLLQSKDPPQGREFTDWHDSSKQSNLINIRIKMTRLVHNLLFYLFHVILNA